MFFIALFCLKILWIEGKGFDEYGIMLKGRLNELSKWQFQKGIKQIIYIDLFYVQAEFTRVSILWAILQASIS